jgi:hypothetical protein
MARIHKPKMEIHLRETIDGLVPTEFIIEGVSVPCTKIHMNLAANDPGEMVLYISMYRIDIIIEKGYE